MREKTFVERVKSFLKLDDDSKISKFHKEVTKELANQVSIRESEKEELVSNLEDLHEHLEEESLNINLERIKTSSDRLSYKNEYIESLTLILEIINKLKYQIEACDGDIAAFKTLEKLFNE